MKAWMISKLEKADTRTGILILLFTAVTEIAFAGWLAWRFW